MPFKMVGKVLEDKVRYLCGLLACSTHTIVLTGAGASTSAGLLQFQLRLATSKSNPLCSGVKQTARGATGQGYSGGASCSKPQFQAGATKDVVSHLMHDLTRPILH